MTVPGSPLGSRFIVERHHGDRYRVTDVATDQIVGKPHPDQTQAAAAAAALNQPPKRRTRTAPAARQAALFDHQEAS